MLIGRWVEGIWVKMNSIFLNECQHCRAQGVKVGTLGRQNEKNSSYVRLAHTFIFGLCFMSVCLMKSNCYSLIYSSLLALVSSGSPNGNKRVCNILIIWTLTLYCTVLTNETTQITFWTRHSWCTPQPNCPWLFITIVTEKSHYPFIINP